MSDAWTELDPTLTQPHLSNRFLLGQCRMLARKYGQAWVEAVLEEAGLPFAYIANPEGWVSVRFMRRFSLAIARRLHGLTELPGYDHSLWQLWREAGRASLEPESLGAAYYALRALGAPGRIYPQIPRLAGRGNVITRMTFQLTGPGKAVIRCEPVGGENLDAPEYCWNRIGVLEALPQLWSLPRATVRHEQCMHRHPGVHDACVYEVAFQDRSLATQATLPLLALAGAGVGVGAGLLAGWGGGALAVTAGLGGVLLAALGQARQHRRLVQLRAEDSARLNDLLEEADRRFRELWEERNELRRALLANRKISGYLTRDVVQSILENPELELTLGGRRTDAAVLFSDLVGFTRRCEGRRPEDVVQELNRYFSHMDRHIEAAGGIIDKRMGDGIMVVFASRADDPEGVDVRRRAVGTALAMLKGLEACNAELAPGGLPPLQMRVGIAAGPLVQGNMGSPVKLEYTVVGDVVNLASRLEGLASPDHVCVDAGVHEAARDLLEGAAVREVAVKGRSERLTVADFGRVVPAVAGKPPSLGA